MTDMLHDWLAYGQELNTLFLWIGGVVFVVVVGLSMGVKISLAGVRWAVRFELLVLIGGLVLWALSEWPF